MILIFDIAVAVISLGLIAGAWQQGFIRALGGLIAFVVSLFGGIYVVNSLRDAIGLDLLQYPIPLLIAFLVISLLISKLLGLVIFVLDAVRKLLSFIPLVGLLNSILGACVGVIQSLILLGAITYFALYAPNVWPFPPSESRAVLVGTVLTGRIIGGLL